MLNQTRTRLLSTLLAALALSALVFASGAGAQRRGSSNQASEGTRGEQTKRVFVGRGSETRQGSRVTITADDTLKDYSAYRSGDRFYVVLPKSAAGAGARGGEGRGYSDMKVEQRGDSVVLSYRVQPGAKPRVEQKFNRLDVVFDVPGGGEQQAAEADAARAQQQQPAQADGRNQTPAVPQANQAAAATPPNANPAAGRGTQPPAGAAAAQGANATPVNAAPPPVTAEQPPAVSDPNAQGVTPPPAMPAQEAAANSTPVGEPQLAQAQPPSAVAPITAAQPASNNQGGASLGTFLLRNWALALVAVLILAGLGLIIAARHTTAAPPPPVESLDEGAAGLPEEPRAKRVSEASAAALREASAAAKASQVTAEEAAGVDSKPLVAATAPAGGVPAAKSRKQSRKESRQEAKRKKKGARTDSHTAPETSDAARIVHEPVAEEPAAEEMIIETSAAAEAQAEDSADRLSAFEEPAVEEVAAPVEESSTTLPVAEVPEVEVSPAREVEEIVEPPAAEVAEVSEAAAAEPTLQTTDIAFVEAEAPAVLEAAGPAAVEQETLTPVVGIEPALAPDPERVQAETRLLLEGGEYDRAVLGTRDPVARQMIAAELLSALAGRNAQRRERARAAFFEHGYFDESARDLRDADAPAERAAAARSLALLGERVATPYLVAALEDPAPDVRRAAVEALGSLGDPAAVAPLESLLVRERNERNRVPPRVIRNAADSCREGAAETPAETPAAAHAPETRELVPASAELEAHAEPTRGFEPPQTFQVATPAEPARSVEVEESSATTSVEIEPVGLASVEVETQTPVEVSASEPARETSFSTTPFVEERGIEPARGAAGAAEMPSWFARGSEPPPVETASAVEEETLVAEAETETLVVEAETHDAGMESAARPHGHDADVSEGLSAAAEAQSFEAAVAEPEAVVETGIQPFTEAEEFEEEIPEAAAARPAEEVALEPYTRPSAGSDSVQAAEHRPASAQAELFDESPAGVVRDIEPAAASSEEKAATSHDEVAEGEWFDFDITELRPERRTPAAETAPAPKQAQAPVFESSSGETLGEAAAEVETDEVESATTVASRGRDVRELEPAVSQKPVREQAAPAAARDGEKGLAPFDEFSTVPASIQQRLASGEPAERAAAIVELSHVDTDEAFHQICAGFDDQAQEVRSAAARALYELRPDRAESFTRALREATPERRREIGAAIASSGLAAESISQLTGESRERTYEAFSLLFLMAKAGEVQPLVRAIEGHPNNEVRLAVVKLLALSGQKEILPAFRRLAVRGSLPTEVRSAVMEAIYQISSSQPTPA